MNIESFKKIYPNNSSRILDIVIFISLIILVSVAGYLGNQKGICGLFHDDGIYVITAKSLAEGKGYRLIHFPGSPRQTKYPVLYPAILAIIWKFWPNFPDNLLAMKLFNLSCGALFIALTYLYLVRFSYCTRPVALASSLLLATAPTFLFYSIILVSEPLFSLLTVMVLWTLQQQAHAPSQGRFKQFFLGILLSLPFWCRTIGVALIFAGLAFFYRLKRPCLWIFLGTVFATFPWVIWTMIGMWTYKNNDAMVYYTSYLGWWFSSAYAIIFVSILNYISIGISVGRKLISILHKNRILIEYLYISIIFGVILALIITSKVIQKIKNNELLAYYLGFSSLIIMIWPWRADRFTEPIMPFFLIFTFNFLKDLSKKVFINKNLIKLVPSLLITFFIVVSLPFNFKIIYENYQTNYKQNLINLGQSNYVHWKSFQNLFEKIKSLTSPNDIIACWHDPMIFLYSDRRSFRPFNLKVVLSLTGKSPFGTADEVARNLLKMNAEYLVKLPTINFDKYFDQIIKELQEKYPNLLEPIYVKEGGRIVIYKIKKGYFRKKLHILP